MIVNVSAYDRLGTDLVIAVSTVDDPGSGLRDRPIFFGRGIVPLAGIDPNNAHDVVFLVGEELLNIAYAAGRRADSAPSGDH